MATHGVVLGGGVVGFLAAAALGGTLDAVTVVERDRFDGPRRGAPQARHAHLLPARGFQAVDELVPGAGDALSAAGAHRIGIPQDIVTCTRFGWMPRFRHDRFLVSMTRPLLESVLRAAVRATVLEGTEAIGLRGGRDAVRAVVVRDRASGEVRTVEADLVVDATGASSKAGRWLADLGLPPVPEVVVDAGIRYATRLYRPDSRFVGAFPAVCVQPEPPYAGHGGVVLPVEGDRWIVSLAGMRGHVPPVGAAGFAAFAGGLRHRLIADLIASAEPLGPARGYGTPSGRLRQYDRMSLWPRGFVVLGDAVSTYNPLYGHGMTVGALHALALRDGLRRHGLDPGLSRSVQRAVGRAGTAAWTLATGQDNRYEGTIAPPRRLPDRIGAWYADRVGAAASVRTEVTAALLDAYTLSAPLSRLMWPDVVRRVIVARGRSADRPPLTPEEEALL